MEKNVMDWSRCCGAVTIYVHTYIHMSVRFYLKRRLRRSSAQHLPPERRGQAKAKEDKPEKQGELLMLRSPPHLFGLALPVVCVWVSASIEQWRVLG